MIKYLCLLGCFLTLVACSTKDQNSNPASDIITQPGPDGSPGSQAGFNFQTTAPLEVRVNAAPNTVYSLVDKRDKKLSTFTTSSNGHKTLFLSVASEHKGLYLEKSDQSRTFENIQNQVIEFIVDQNSLQNFSSTSEPLDENAIDGATYGYQFFPAEKKFATLVFEDLWPHLGDYDFNDLVVDYNIQENLNSDGLISKIKIQLKVVGTLASMKNGFGFQLGVSPLMVSSVEGAKYTRGYTELEANGVEARQSKAVIIAFENAKDHHNPDDVSKSELLTLTINFASGVSREQLGFPPYNPFLMSNGERGREIHLPGYSPTDLVNIPYFDSEDDTSNLTQGRTYIDTSGLPWAVNLPETFFYPLDSKGVDQTYLNFLEWVETEGKESLDWYRDKPNYRETKYIHRKRGTEGYLTCEDPFAAHTLLARYDSSNNASILDGLNRTSTHPNFNGDVMTWKDISGNGYDVKAKVHTTAPKFSIDSGVSELQKDSHVLGTSNDYLLVDIPDVTSDFTFILVATPSHENPDDFDSFFSNSMSPSESGSWQLGVRANDKACPGSIERPAFATYLRDGSKNVVICGGHYNDGRNVFSIHYSASTQTMTFSRNGYVEGSYKWETVPTFRYLKMFMNRASSRYFDGKIHEMVLITSPLSLEENSLVGHYLSCKWQVEL